MKKIILISLVALSMLSISCKKDEEDNGPSNAAPTVSFTNPVNNSGFMTSGSSYTITISVNSADSDGTVTKLELYDNTTLLTTINDPDATSNYTQALSVGTHTLKAVVTDNSLATSFAEVEVIIMPNIVVIPH